MRRVTRGDDEANQRWQTVKAALQWRAMSGPPRPAGAAEKAAVLAKIFAAGRADSAPTPCPVPSGTVPDTAAVVDGWVSLTDSATTAAESRTELGVYADALARQVAGEHSGKWPAQRIGRALASGWRVTPRSFQNMLELLVPWLKDQDCGGTGRWSSVLAELVGGFGDGVRTRALGEQSCVGGAAPSWRGVPQAADTVRHDLTSEESAQFSCVLSPDGHVIDINTALSSLLGHSGDPQAGIVFGDHLGGPRDRAAFDEVLRDVAAGAGFTGSAEVTVADLHGQDVARVSIVAVRQASGSIHMTLHDVPADHVRRQQPSSHDDLDDVTRLPNQQSFLAQVQSVMDRPPTDVVIGMCALRIGNLGAVGRHFGDDLGDRVVTTVAARITAAVIGMPTTMVGRLGIDTFGVLIADGDGWRGITDTVRRLVDWVSEPVRVEDQELVLHPAAGLAEARDDMTASQLLARAQLMLRPGAEPQIRRQMSEPRRSATDEIAHLLAALPGAFAGGQIVVAYSPIVRLSDDMVVGTEASTWWKLPDGTRRQIDDLIELADEIGIGLRWAPWILGKVLHQASRWRTTLGDAAPRITVNLPRRVAQDEHLVEVVEAALLESGVSGSQLMLSIPHAAIVPVDEAPLGSLVRLGGIRVPVAVDGAGIDFAAYEALTRIPVASVVIPPQLTRSLDDPGTEDGRREVAAALIRIGCSVSREVTVRGVTTAAQREYARGLSAALGQGTLFGGPQSPESIEQLVAGGPGTG